MRGGDPRSCASPPAADEKSRGEAAACRVVYQPLPGRCGAAGKLVVYAARLLDVLPHLI
jgi:hypothetical protein